MVFACVIAANLFNGLNTNVWTIWVFLAVFFGIGFLLVYTVGISSLIIPYSFSPIVYRQFTTPFHLAGSPPPSMEIIFSYSIQRTFGYASP